MRKLTEKTAYWISYLLWNWLAKTDCDDKANWPGWKKWNAIYGGFGGFCSLCEFYMSRCSKCLEKCSSLWNPQLNSYIGNCTHTDSPYYKWTRTKSAVTRKKYATIMARTFKRIHKEL